MSAALSERLRVRLDELNLRIMRALTQHQEAVHRQLAAERTYIRRLLGEDV